MPSSITVRAAADSFLDSIRSANTRRAYTTAVDKTTAAIGDPRLLAAVADDEIGETLETLWGSSAVNSWNARPPRRCRVVAGVVPRTQPHRPSGQRPTETICSSAMRRENRSRHQLHSGHVHCLCINMQAFLVVVARHSMVVLVETSRARCPSDTPTAPVHPVATPRRPNAGIPWWCWSEHPGHAAGPTSPGA